MVEEDTKRITTDKKKLSFLIFQSLLYFSILFFFSKELTKRFTHRVVFFGHFLQLTNAKSMAFIFWSTCIFVSATFHNNFDKNNCMLNFLIGIILGLVFLQMFNILLFSLIIFCFLLLKLKKKN